MSANATRNGVRTRQPIQGTGLRHNHRLAKGLVFATTGAAGFVDFVSGIFPNSKTGAVVNASKGGRTATPAAGSGRITWPTGSTGLDKLTGPGTILVCMRSNNNARNWRAFGSREDNNTGDGVFLLYDDYSNATNGFNAGGNNNNYRADSASGALGTNSEQSFHTFGFSWNGTSIQLWADGKLNRTVTGGNAAFTPNANTSRITRLQSDTLASDFLFAYAWNRVLSAAEIADITANPWQIFTGTRDPIYAAVLSSGITAAGGNTVSTTRSAAGSVKVTGTSAHPVSTTSAAAGTVKVVGSSSKTVSTTSTAAGGVKVVGTSSKAVSTTSTGAAHIGAAPVTAGSSTTVSTTSAATAKTKVTGSSSKAVSTTSAAVGAVKITGTSSKTVSVTNTASGVIGAAPAVGTSSTTVATTSTATGKTRVAGTSAHPVSTTSTAAGKARVAGISSRTVSTTSTAAGKTAVKASSTRTVSTSNTGTASVGNPPIIASANQTLLPIASVQTGKVKVSGTSSKAVSITAAGTAGVKVRGAGGNTAATAQAAAAATTVRGTSSRQVSTTTSGSGTVGFPPRIASSSTIAGVNASGSGTVAIRAAASTQARISPYGAAKVALRAQGGNIVDWATHTIAMQGVPIPRPPSGATSFSRSVTVPYRPWSCDRVASYTVDVTG